MTTGDNQQTLTVKKIPLRDLPNETQNVIIQSPQKCAMRKDGGNVLESPKVSGIKRYRSDVSPNHTLHQSSGAGAINGHVSHFRSKLGPKGLKLSFGNYGGNDDPLKPKFFGVEEKSVLLCDQVKDSTTSKSSFINMNAPSSDKYEEHEQVHVHGYETSHVVGAPLSLPYQGSSGSISLSKQQTGFPLAEKDGLETTLIPSGSRKEDKLSWKDRFVHLQAYLKACDESSQDEYIQKLRSLSAVGRSKFAVELEKRAIHLLLEEGKELYKMKALNVLGRSSNEAVNLPVFNSPIGVATVNDNKP